MSKLRRKGGRNDALTGPPSLPPSSVFQRQLYRLSFPRRLPLLHRSLLGRYPCEQRFSFRSCSMFHQQLLMPPHSFLLYLSRFFLDSTRSEPTSEAFKTAMRTLSLELKGEKSPSFLFVRRVSFGIAVIDHFSSSSLPLRLAWENYVRDGSAHSNSQKRSLELAARATAKNATLTLGVSFKLWFRVVQ